MTNRTNSTTLIRLVAVVVIAAGWATVTQRLNASEPSRDTATAPHLSFIDEPTPSQRETISWAVGRFAAAGLQLPDLEIRFPVFCDGKGALYHVGRSSIDLCRVNKKNVLHELAHAWDDTSGAVDREGFMNLRGVSVWFGGLDVPAREQGSEHLAIVITWGLMDPDARSAHGLPHNSDAELTEAFELVTGAHPPTAKAIRQNRPGTALALFPPNLTTALRPLLLDPARSCRM